MAASSCKTKGEGAASGRAAGTEAERVSGWLAARPAETTTALGGLTAGFGGVGISPTGISALASSAGGPTGCVDFIVWVPGGVDARGAEGLAAAGLGATLLEVATGAALAPEVFSLAGGVTSGFFAPPEAASRSARSIRAIGGGGFGFSSFLAITTGSSFFSPMTVATGCVFLSAASAGADSFLIAFAGGWPGAGFVSITPGFSTGPGLPVDCAPGFVSAGG